jgi:hypothetical protein
MSEPGRKKRNHDPGFDPSAEEVAQRHEDRREVIAENVEEQRQEDLDNVESAAEEMEIRRAARAEDLEAAALHRMRFIAFFALAAALLAIGVAIVTWVQADRIDGNQRAIARLNGQAFDRTRSAELRVCQRVQLLRDQINGVNLLVYDTFAQVVEQQRKLLKAPGLTKTQRTMTRQSLHRAEKVTKTSVVTGPTDCVKAVDHPEQYIPPPPKLISKDGHQVRDARDRAAGIVAKARKGEPLYRPTP